MKGYSDLIKVPFFLAWCLFSLLQGCNSKKEYSSDVFYSVESALIESKFETIEKDHAQKNVNGLVYDKFHHFKYQNTKFLKLKNLYLTNYDNDENKVSIYCDCEIDLSNYVNDSDHHALEVELGLINKIVFSKNNKSANDHLTFVTKKIQDAFSSFPLSHIKDEFKDEFATTFISLTQTGPSTYSFILSAQIGLK